LKTQISHFMSKVQMRGLRATDIAKMDANCILKVRAG
jgi:hypothetical protein